MSRLTFIETEHDNTPLGMLKALRQDYINSNQHSANSIKKLQEDVARIEGYIDSRNQEIQQLDLAIDILDNTFQAAARHKQQMDILSVAISEQIRKENEAKEKRNLEMQDSISIIEKMQQTTRYLQEKAKQEEREKNNEE
jgi:hypothetical protein